MWRHFEMHAAVVLATLLLPASTSGALTISRYSAAKSSAPFRRTSVVSPILPLSTVARRRQQQRQPHTKRGVLLRVTNENDSFDATPTLIRPTHNETTTMSEGEEKPRSGLLTALLVGPPLFAKFVIVLLVKFLTDAIVFPLLFLYRMSRSAKHRLVNLFRRNNNSDDAQTS